MPNPKHITERLFVSPSKYIQGPNAIKYAARYLASLGKAPLLIADAVVYKLGKSSGDHRKDGTYTAVQRVRILLLPSRRASTVSRTKSSRVKRPCRRLIGWL